MFTRRYILLFLLFCGAAAMQTGCSISYSLEKSSDSVSESLDSLTSISTSSSGGEETKVTETATVYEEDIAAATVLYASHDQNRQKYQRQITRIARKHGIADWEREPVTFEAMGMGLKRAGVAENSIAGIPYFHSLSTTPHFGQVLKGFHM